MSVLDRVRSGEIIVAMLDSWLVPLTDNGKAKRELMSRLELGERMRWVSVGERLPDKSGSYLCWYMDGFGNKGYWVGYWDDGRKGFYPKWPNNPSRHEKYWMLLPEPPKEGAE